MENVKKTNYLKRSLSYVLTLVMLLSCWVFTPIAEKAEAATAGTYYVRVHYNVTNATDSDHIDEYSITLTYKASNGTGTESTSKKDMNVSSTGTKYLEWSSVGFPTKIKILGDGCGTGVFWAKTDQCDVAATKIEVGATSSSTLTTLWTGEAYVESEKLDHWASIDYNGNKDGDDKSYGVVKSSSGSWSSKLPKPSSISSFSIASSSTIPTSRSTTVTATMGTIKDQYDVNWYQDPYVAVSGRTGVTASARTTISVDSTAMYTSSPWYTDCTVTARAGSATGTQVGESKTLRVTNPQYTVTWKWYKTNTSNFASPTLESDTTTAYYNQTPTAPTDKPISYYTNTKHYTGGKFSPSKITGATTFTMSYTANDHSWSTYTSKNNGTHNRACSCGYNEDVACVYDKEVVSSNYLKTAATCTSPAVYYKSCVCGYSDKTSTTPTFTNGSALGHDYNTPTYTWDGTRCTATRVCKRDSSHIETETVSANVTVTRNKTCDLDELSTYTATFSNSAFATQTRTNVTTASKTGHNFTGEYKYNEATKTHTRLCVNSGCDLYGDERSCSFTSEVTTQPTCIEKGVRTYTCSDCGGQYTEDVEPLGHNYQPYNWTWNGYESASVSLVCANDSNHTRTETATITSEITTEPLCETTGLKVYTATASFNGQTFTATKEEVLPALGHVEVTDPAVEPTENSVGFTQGSHCSRCDNAIVKQKVLPMKEGGHSESADANAVKTEYAPAEGCTYVGVTTNVSDDSQILEVDPKKSTTVKGDFGTFTISPDGEKADFKINSMQFTEVETFYLVTKVQIPHTDKFVYAYEKITVVPDSVIYYEDSFETETDSETGAQKKNGIVYTDGTGAGYGAWEVCGSSEASEAVDFGGIYENCASFSNGTAHRVTVSDANNPLNGGTWPKATFTFAGTGFDIVSLTDSGSGIFAVTVMQGEDIVRKCIVDTYYGYTYGNLYYRTHTKEIVTDRDVRFATYGDAVALYPTGIVVKTEAERDNYKDNPDYAISSGNGKVYTTSPSLSNNGGVQATGWYRDKFAPNSEVIYQVPVIHITDLDYGTYTVTVEARFYSSFGHFGVDGEGNKFYNLCIDAVRVYNPAQNSEVAKEAYAAKGEANVGYTLIKDAIVGTDRVDGFGSVSGALFLDGSSTIDSTNLAEYLRASPNNELYLSDGQSITFDLSTLAYNKVQIGMKAVNGKTVPVTVSYNGKTAPFQIKTATEIYYSLTELLDVETIIGTVVITNSGNGSAILGLTSLRTAYTEKTQSNSSPMMLSAKTAPVAEALVLANAPAREQSKTAETAPALQKLLERIAMIFRSIIEMYFSK